jgi:hypothetical protein
MLAQPDRFKPDGPLNPVAFFHRTLSSSERNYSTTDRELLAIALAVKKSRVYLAGKRFDLITDHRALTWINDSLDLNDVYDRRGRWLEFLHTSGRKVARIVNGSLLVQSRTWRAGGNSSQAESESAYRIFPMFPRKDVHGAQEPVNNDGN